MKVVTPEEMVRLETQARHQGFSDAEFMEKAGLSIANEVENFVRAHYHRKRVFLLIGKGNNGGDALVAGRVLLERGYEVIAIVLQNVEECSPLCQKNLQLFLEKSGKWVQRIPFFGKEGIILDGIFGTGFKGRSEAPYDSLIKAANQSGLPILAVDIPSGLDGTTGRAEGEVICAQETFFLGLPKTGFFLEEGWNVCGKLREIDFGFPSLLIDEIHSHFQLIQGSFVASFLPKIQRNRHKYQSGVVVGLAGSLMMPGAALLASLSALRGGAGIMRLLFPQGLEYLFAEAPYEVIRIPYAYDKPQEGCDLLQQGHAAFIGPGLGREKNVQEFLSELIPSLSVPCVIDADALFFFAQKKCKLPPQTIFTPHAGEMQRLLHLPERQKIDFEYLKKCQEFAEENKITLVHKGAPTFVFSPGEPTYVNPSGDPGMATAGCGDVLTGLLAALLAQGLTSHKAALLGVLLHGLAGEMAAHRHASSRGLIASDLIASLGEAYHRLELITHAANDS